MRDRYLVAPSCPSTLALERLASGDVSRADLKAHVGACAACTARLDEMWRQHRDFSESSSSFDARSAFRRADTRWKRNAMIVALAPLAAAAVLVTALPSKAPPVVASVQPKPAAVQARAVQSDLLEPRGTAPAPRLHPVVLRGPNVELGPGGLEGPPGDGPPQPSVPRRTDGSGDVTG